MTKKPKNMAMGRRTKLIVRTLIAAIVIAPVAFFAASQSNTVNLVCILEGSSDGPSSYVFRINIPKFFGKPRVLWADANRYLQLMKFDDTALDAVIGIMAENPEGLTPKEFIAQHGFDPRPLTDDLLPKQQMRHGAHMMGFEFNRLTGTAQLNFYRGSPHDNRLKIIGTASENGSCSSSKPVF